MERDAFPDLYRTVDRLEWRADAIDKWRADVDARIAVLESEIITEREARRLREALARQGHIRLTTFQKWAGILVGCVALADLVRGFVG